MGIGDILKEVSLLLRGMVDALPSTTITAAAAVILLILFLIQGRVAIFLFFVALSYLFIRSFIAASGGDIYSLGLARIVAGVGMGVILLFLDIYLFVKLLFDWRE